MKDDNIHMQRAIELARRGLGHTSPNPLVGCVIVRRGRIVAEGWHKACGGDHAEIDALKKAGIKARGGVMYVTLEPCHHWGRTPPCVDAVIAAGIRRVVVAMKDPDPRTNGKSIRKLKARGLEVVTGVCERDAREMNAAFIKYIQKRMPYIIGKTAETMNGKVGFRSGGVRWITSRATRETARQLRNGFDAIVVGVGTVLADDPRLNAPGKLLQKVVVDSCGRTPMNARIFRGMAHGQVIIATTRKASVEKILGWRHRGSCVMVCPEKSGKVDLSALFKALAKNGLIRILIEGGPTLLNAAIKQGLVDRIHLYTAVDLIVQRPDAVDGINMELIKNVSMVQIKMMGRDRFMALDIQERRSNVHRDH